MPVELTFASALLVGLLGSTHCIGMCGGIITALSLGTAPRRTAPLAYQLAYNAGRIGSYVLVGLAAGLLGGGLARFGPGPEAGRLLAAAFMVALGLYLTDWWRGLAALEKLGFRLWRHIRPLADRLLPVTSLSQAFLLGIFWGWLPCGLVYAAVAWSLSTGNALDGAVLMLGFGIGTLPALLVAGNALQALQGWVRSRRVRTAAGIAVMALGLYSAGGVWFGATHDHHHRSQRAASVSAEPVSALEATRAPAILRRVV